jgi:hypothetical protein
LRIKAISARNRPAPQAQRNYRIVGITPKPQLSGMAVTQSILNVYFDTAKNLFSRSIQDPSELPAVYKGRYFCALSQLIATANHSRITARA